MAVLDPVKLELTNWAELFGSDGAPRAVPRAGASAPPRARRSATFALGREVWIERDDFEEVPPKGFFRLFPGNKVRLKYGYVVECTGCEKDADGSVTAVLATLVPDTKSGTPGADAVKVKGTITWVGVARLRCRPKCGCTTACSPSRSPTPAARTSGRAEPATASSVVAGYVEPSLGDAARRRRASSSSATATSSPTASTTRPAGRCSTASRRCATPGRAGPADRP